MLLWSPLMDVRLVFWFYQFFKKLLNRITLMGIFSVNYFNYELTYQLIIPMQQVRYHRSHAQNELNVSIAEFKARVRYFHQILFFHQTIALPKLWKMLISSKKLFSFSRYSYLCISVLTFFSTCQPLLKRMIEDKS